MPSVGQGARLKEPVNGIMDGKHEREDHSNPVSISTQGLRERPFPLGQLRGKMNHQQGEHLQVERLENEGDPVNSKTVSPQDWPDQQNANSDSTDIKGSRRGRDARFLCPQLRLTEPRTLADHVEDRLQVFGKRLSKKSNRLERNRRPQKRKQIHDDT